VSLLACVITQMYWAIRKPVSSMCRNHKECGRCAIAVAVEIPGTSSSKRSHGGRLAPLRAAADLGTSRIHESAFCQRAIRLPVSWGFGGTVPGNPCPHGTMFHPSNMDEPDRVPQSPLPRNGQSFHRKCLFRPNSLLFLQTLSSWRWALSGDSPFVTFPIDEFPLLVLVEPRAVQLSFLQLALRRRIAAPPRAPATPYFRQSSNSRLIRAPETAMMAPVPYAIMITLPTHIGIFLSH